MKTARLKERDAAVIPPGPADEAVLLDPVIHERTRLAILTALSTSPEGERSFMDLRLALKLTDGNLMAHLRTLDAARLVDCVKTGAGRGSNTTVKLTGAGRQRFRVYLDRLEQVIHAARGGRAGTGHQGLGS